jgi:hypothetical protein
VRLIALPALLCLTVVVGCGGGSKSTTTGVATSAGQPQSKANYIEVADAVCSNHQSRREDLESQASDVGPLTSPAKARRVAGLLRKEADNLLAEAQDLDGLAPPQGGREKVALLIRDIRGRAQAIEQWARAYDGPDETAIRRGQIRVGQLTVATEQEALSYGFDACGR